MRKGFFFILTLSILLAPAVLYAAGLVPCGGTGQSACRACDLVSLAQRVLQWLIMIMAFVIALTFAFGGFKMIMSAGNEGAVSSAKEMMTNSVIGFLILLSGWLIVDTVLKKLVGDNLGRPWNEIQCVEVQDVAVAPPVTEECADDTALMEKYNGSPVGVDAPGLQALISCYMQDAAVREATDTSQLYTVDRSHPRCSLTNGNTACGACSHSTNSCHYGRGSGAGAKAVDFNAKSGFTEAQLFSRLQARRATCGGTLITEGDHSHISMPGC